MDRILLTGGSGFLGAAVARELARRTIPVTALTCRLEEIQPKSLDFGAVIHCAGALRHRPTDHVISNQLGTDALLRGLARPDTRVLFVSSRGVYAPSAAAVIDETAAVGPPDSYGMTKLLAEQAVMTSGRPFVILRPTTLVGAGVNNIGRSFLAASLVRMRRGEEVILHEPDRDIDFLDVNDLAVTIAGLLSVPRVWGEIYNAAGPPRSLHGLMRQLADEFECRTGIRPQLKLLPGPPARAPLLDCRRLHAALPNVTHRDDSCVCAELVNLFERLNS